MSKAKIGFALCGSFCTIESAVAQMRILAEQGYEIIPIMSNNASTIDTRFGKAKDIKAEIEAISGRQVIDSIVQAEPIGPKKMCDLMIVAPATGNTVSKLANGITDSSVVLKRKLLAPP